MKQVCDYAQRRFRHNIPKFFLRLVSTTIRPTYRRCETIRPQGVGNVRIESKASPECVDIYYDMQKEEDPFGFDNFLWEFIYVVVKSSNQHDRRPSSMSQNVCLILACLKPHIWPPLNWSLFLIDSVSGVVPKVFENHETRHVQTSMGIC